MEKIDLVLIVMLALFSLNVVFAAIRTYKGWFVDGDRLHASIRRDIARGNFSEALQLCEETLSKRPHDSNVLWFEADLLFRLGKLDQAKEKWEHILSHEPAWSDDAKKYIEAIESKNQT